MKKYQLLKTGRVLHDLLQLEHYVCHIETHSDQL